MSTRLVKANEIESITSLAAKSFARVLEAEKREKPSIRGRIWVDSVTDALNAAPEDLTWNAIGQFEDETQAASQQSGSWSSSMRAMSWRAVSAQPLLRLVISDRLREQGFLSCVKSTFENGSRAMCLRAR